MFLKEKTPLKKENPVSVPPLPQKKKSDYELIVFSHLRWDFVYQRPQHIISRMAENRKTLFIEETLGICEKSNSLFHMETVSSNLDVLKPKVSSIYDIHKILKLLPINSSPMVWFYSPSFMELLPFLNPSVVVYDCMDELSLFKGAPAIIKEQEQELMKRANIIFTGGISLYESKSAKAANVHCFPSSVDYCHFKKALSNLEIPEDMKNFKNPTIGYIGVIDERIDMHLLLKSAELLPQFEFVMIGPLAKIGEDDLAKRENIHYLGMKSYEQLPFYLKALDITMMPFALNDATRFISPTKTLEYMAAEKPIVSTAIKDVVRQYSDSVKIVKTAEDFRDAIQQIEKEKSRDYASLYGEIMENTSWNSTAEKMNQLLSKIPA